GPDADRFVRELDWQRFAIRLAVRDDGLRAERATGAQHPQGDLAAVGDEDLAEHAQISGDAVANSMRMSSCPYSTASPASTRLAPTTPSAGATTSCGTPSMSTDPSRSPARTLVPARASGRGLKMPTAGELATIRPWSRTPPSRGSRASRPSRPSLLSRSPSRPSRPGPTGV